jgi:TonB family protein
MTESVDTITLDRDLMESIDNLRVRPYEKSALGPVVLCSIIIHVLLLALILFRPMTSSARLTFGPYYTVDLVRYTDLAGRSSYQSGFAEEMKGLLHEKQGVILKKKTETLDLPPISRLDAKQKSSREVNKAIEDLKKKMAANPRAQHSPAATDDAGQGDASRETDEMNAYYGAIWSRIKAKWAFPGGLLPQNDLVAVVHVRIMRNGATEGVSLEKRSSNSFFNDSAIKAVKKASPFPSLPGGMRDSSIEVGIRFHSSQLIRR